MPEITPPRTSFAAELSTVTVVAAVSGIGTLNVLVDESCEESIEVNDAVLLLLAEIE